MPFRPDRLRGIKPTSDLIDAKTGKVAIEAGRKVTARLAKKLADEGLKELLVGDEDLHGRYLAQDIVNMETGEIYRLVADIRGVFAQPAFMETFGARCVPSPSPETHFGRQVLAAIGLVALSRSEQVDTDGLPRALSETPVEVRH